MLELYQQCALQLRNSHSASECSATHRQYPCSLEDLSNRLHLIDIANRDGKVVLQATVRMR